ncbi:MAG: DUF2877 domain-containing protein [Atopobiaceae bacterium]|jgi:hypothetical protein
MAVHARISSRARTIIEPTCRGYVVSVFSHGFDICFNPDELVYIGGYDKPLSCIGVQLEPALQRALMRTVSAGDEVYAEAGVLRFEKEEDPYTLNLSSLVPTELKISHSLTPEAQARLVNALMASVCMEKTGLRDLSAAATYVAALAEGGTSAQEAAIRWLYGRGPGLTPSGDDILCGYGAGLLAGGNARGHAHFSRLLDEVAKERTTTYVSRAYLRAMQEGYVNEQMLALFGAAEVNQDLRQMIDRCKDYGHSSGTDMLVGLGCALMGASARLLNARSRVDTRS